MKPNFGIIPVLKILKSEVFLSGEFYQQQSKEKRQSCLGWE
jgi:hypothetical protein